MAVGQALVNAKQRYAGAAITGGFSVFDEKSMIEATLYGLPMFTVTVPSPQDIGGSDITVSKTAEVPPTGSDPLGSITYSIQATLQQEDTDYGTYFHIGDEVQAWPGRPIQPRAAFVLDEMAGQVPHGQILLGAEYTDLPAFDPVVTIPLTQDSLPEPAFNAPGWYPSKLWSINEFGDQNRSTLVFGQFEPDFDTERLYNSMELQTFYSTHVEGVPADYDPPLIWGLASEIDDAGAIGFAATVDDAERVWVTVSYPNGDGTGTLVSHEMARDDSDPALWTADVTGIDPAYLYATEYYVQALDAAGNVATASKEGFHLASGYEPDAYQSINNERELEIVLEFNYGDGAGYVPLVGETATEVTLTGATIVAGSDTCSPGTAGADGDGICRITITSDTPGDSFLTVKYVKEVDDPNNPGQMITVTNASFTFITRWWAGTASIHKSFEQGPFTQDKPVACFTVTPEGSAEGEQVCSDGSGEFEFTWDNLAAGNYTMQETSTGGDFVLIDPIGFTIDTGHQDFRAPTVENKLKQAELTIRKQHGDGSTWTGPEVTFEIYNCGEDLNCGTDTFLAARVVVPDPEFGSNPVSVSLPECKYRVIEIPPPGYLPLEGDQIRDLNAGASVSLTFTNITEGCSPGFWQGGNGSQLWNEGSPPDSYDPDWLTYPGGLPGNPYIHGTHFNDFFEVYEPLNGVTMMDLVGTGGATDDFQKAARNVVAAYLNASWGMAFPHTTQEIDDMWSAAVESGDFLGLHLYLAPLNAPPDGVCPIQ
jgi:hypothetical protein